MAEATDKHGTGVANRDHFWPKVNSMYSNHNWADARLKLDWLEIQRRESESKKMTRSGIIMAMRHTIPAICSRIRGLRPLPQQTQHECFGQRSSSVRWDIHFLWQKVSRRTNRLPTSPKLRKLYASPTSWTCLTALKSMRAGLSENHHVVLLHCESLRNHWKNVHRWLR
jgi:hypothetical protein